MLSFISRSSFSCLEYSAAVTHYFSSHSRSHFILLIIDGHLIVLLPHWIWLLIDSRRVFFWKKWPQLILWVFSESLLFSFLMRASILSRVVLSKIDWLQSEGTIIYFFVPGILAGCGTYYLPLFEVLSVGWGGRFWGALLCSVSLFLRLHPWHFS